MLLRIYGNHYYCCFAHLSTSPQTNECTVCGKFKPAPEDMRPEETVSYIPLVPRLGAVISDDVMSHQLFSYRETLESGESSDAEMRDYFDSSSFKDLCDIYGGAENMKHDIFIGASTDGFQAFKNNSCDVWPIVAVLFNLPPESRFMSKNVLPLMFIPNDVQPKDLQYFLISFVNELPGTLEDDGVESHLPTGETVRFRVHLIWFTADFAGLVKIAGINGHVGRHPCRFCLLRASIHRRSNIITTQPGSIP